MHQRFINSIQYFTPNKNRQHGTSLFIALVLLIALTLIGVSSMSTAVIELKMANNSKQQSTSFNQSDELLTIAEQEIATIINNVKNGSTASNPFLSLNPTDGYYLTHELNQVDTNQLNWSLLNKNNGPGGNFIIEFLGKRVLPGESNDDNADNLGDQFYAFRISARSETGKAVRLMQSIYVTNSPPF
jgi:Tfp pilus assembly protein PilX